MTANRKDPPIIEQLRAIILADPQSTNAFAKAAGVDQANLNHWLDGKRGISITTFAKLCEHLKLELARRR